ncbi:oligopeptidase B [Gonapodya prolifera JEL478]|uniref:Prolyl endopeptidase n=1 Tax=Gonapodya prolifera (strain JEL478) TaxID=1344416 RepID=A0A139AXA7_GONPJ|nr:oligopeptidase B [Gonapodya prolifera JEL478]|eukprot:KXS21376.1 oligopeptidase B [Gonapodya prolifera JEL478]
MSAPTPPLAKKVDYVHKFHEREFPDPYQWLRDDAKGTKRADIVDHLTSENNYARGKMAPYAELKETLYNEFLSRIQEDDTDVPLVKGSYLYYKRTEKGKQYPIWCRRVADTDRLVDDLRDVNGSRHPEEIVLDLNLFEHKYLELGAFTPEPTNKILAYALDTSGNEYYDVYFRDLSTGKDLPDVLRQVDSGVTWSHDSKSVYYTKYDDSQRPYRIFKHIMGAAEEEDVMLYEETDEKFRVDLTTSNSKRFIFVQLESGLTNEIRFIDSKDPTASLQVFQPRIHELKYDVEHFGDGFIVLTNDGREHINNRICWCPIDATGRENWKEIAPYDPYTHLIGVEPFQNFLAVYEKNDGLTKIHIHYPNAATGAIDTSKSYRLQFEEEVYAIQPLSGSNQIYASSSIRFAYSSPVTPRTVYLHNIESHSDVVLKRTPVPNYDPTLYGVLRLSAPVDPATLPDPEHNPDDKVFVKTPVQDTVPISVVYRKDNFRRDGTNPCLLYGYGSYGISMDMAFRSDVISYLDRGFTRVVCHIRGGGDNGKSWYENGRFLHKKNTFVDFIASAEHIIKEKITSSDILAIEGRSAGGMLMGAVLNMRPELFRLAIAGVPFVDVVNTMMDASIPLTVNEYEEWGNPNDIKFFNYMLSYSPYNNVPVDAKSRFPDILVQAGINDPRVAYWEPSKWVAKMRELGVGGPGSRGDLLYLIEMGSGHFGNSGRYEYLRYTAEYYAFTIGYMSKYRKDGVGLEKTSKI